VSEFAFKTEIDFLANHNSGDQMGAANLLSVLISAPASSSTNRTDECIAGIRGLCPALEGPACIQCVGSHAPQLKFLHNCSIGDPSSTFQADLMAACRIGGGGNGGGPGGMINQTSSPLTGYCIDFVLEGDAGVPGDGGGLFSEYMSCNSCLEEECPDGSPAPADGGAVPICSCQEYVRPRQSAI